MMNEDFGQRRRFAVALALTVILAPAAFLFNRGSGDEADDAPTGTLVGEVMIDGQPMNTEATSGNNNSSQSASSSTDPMGTTPEEIIIGTVPAVDDEPATIAIPRPSRALQGTATFSRSIESTAACQIKNLETIPFDSEVTVTNLDNSRSVRCKASVGGVAPDHSIVLNADAFLQIGDLTDAPLSVELTW